MRLLLSLRRPPSAAALIAFLLVSAPLAGQSAPETGEVRPGDVLRITVFRKPELSGEVEVGENGVLLHPLYRDVQATGLSATELEGRLDMYLQRFEADPSFIMEHLVRVTVSGEVRQPQVYTLRPYTTVFQAVAAAGGVAPTGTPNRAVLMRDGVTRRLDLSVPGSAGAAERVRSGDVIVVERRSTAVRDLVAPIASLVAAGAALINLLRS